MMKSVLQCDGKILIVGDGDFSFSVSLVKHSDLQPCQVFTSNLESESSISHHAQASQNMAILKDLGVSVFLETDARDLHNHPIINKEKFDKILFNFPLADRHNIKKNRSLLGDFFSSCGFVLTSKGQVLVTLCKGQGGTPADQPIRSWHDSWQIVAMATNASFLLHKVVPFDPTDFPEYHSVGFRFQDKSFNVTGALTHAFERGRLVEDVDWNMRGVVTHSGAVYSTSRYVESCLKRNLLEEEGNPVCKMRQCLEERLKQSPSVASLDVQRAWSPIIPSHQSRVFASKTEKTDIGLEASPNRMDENKDWKNSENLKRMNKRSLAHGVAGSESDEKDAMTTDCRDNKSPFMSVPSHRENVFILVKVRDTVSDILMSEEEQEDIVEEEKVKCENASSNVSDDERVCLNGNGVEVGGNDMECESSSVGCGSTTVTDVNLSSQVYHCRTSLLETLTFSCKVLNEKSDDTLLRSDDASIPFPQHDCVLGEDNCHGNGLATRQVDVPTPGSDKQKTLSPTSPPVSVTSSMTPQITSVPKSVPCLVSFGVSLLPCHIAHNASPIKHEMLILHRLTSDKHPSNQNTGQFHFISSHILKLLQDFHFTESSLVFALNDIAKDSACKIKIEGVDEIQMVCKIITESSFKDRTDVSIGFIFRSRIGKDDYHLTLIDLQSLVCHLFRIDDWRVLWSDNPKFLDQFEYDRLPSIHPFHPFSLYPMKFVHDLSFWEPEDKCAVFDVFDLYRVIWNVAGDLVVDVHLIDTYEDPQSKRRSRCYRLHFMSSDKCLPYSTSWKLQSKIRMEAARSLGVQLR